MSNLVYLRKGRELSARSRRLLGDTQHVGVMVRTWVFTLVGMGVITHPSIFNRRMIYLKLYFRRKKVLC
jgi:hypothetical protein